MSCAPCSGTEARITQTKMMINMMEWRYASPIEKTVVSGGRLAGLVREGIQRAEATMTPLSAGRTLDWRRSSPHYAADVQSSSLAGAGSWEKPINLRANIRLASLSEAPPNVG